MLVHLGYNFRMKSRKTLVISVIILGIAFGIFFIFLLSDFIVQKSSRRQMVFYETLGKNFARNSANAIAAKDIFSLKMFARDMAQSENVAYAVISDDTGNVMARSDSEKSYRKETISDIIIPIDILDARWGEIKIGFSNYALKSEAATVRKYVFGFGFFILAGAAAYIFFFPNTIIIPIMRLTTKGIVGEEQRKFTRALTNVDVDFAVNGAPPVNGRMADISIAGAKLFYPDSTLISKGDAIELDFAVSTDGKSPEQKYTINGFVTWLAAGKAKSCGIQFKSINLIDRMKLADFINSTKAKQEAWLREKLDGLAGNSTRH